MSSYNTNTNNTSINVIKLRLQITPKPPPVFYGYIHPELYLTLLENKVKVKKELLIEEYIVGTRTVDVRNFNYPSLTDKSQQPEYIITEGQSNSYHDYDDFDTESSCTGEAGEGDIASYNGDNVETGDEPFSKISKPTYMPQFGNQNLHQQTHVSKLDLLTNNGEETINNPPSINSLTQQYNQVYRQNDDEKMTIISEFNLLKRKYQSADIPFVSMHMELQHMKDLYARTIRDLQLDQKHQTHRTYLIMGFYVVEFVLGHFFKLNMTGFAKQQVNDLEKYDRLLIELGAKHYVPNAPEKFPVEVRLIGMIILQTALFVLIQKMTSGSSKEGKTNGLANLFTMFTNPTKLLPQIGKTNEKTSNESENKPRTAEQPSDTQKTMKGPRDM